MSFHARNYCQQRDDGEDARTSSSATAEEAAEAHPQPEFASDFDDCSIVDLAPPVDYDTWVAYLLQMIAAPSLPYAMHFGPRPHCVLRLCAPCTVTVCCNERRERFRVRGATDAAKAALLREITTRFSTEERPLQFIELAEWATLSDGDIITLQGAPSPLPGLLRRASAGDASAQVEAAKLLAERGEYDKALAWFRRAAEAGDRNAAYRYGVMMATEKSVLNFAEAERWLTAAALMGLAKAEAWLQRVRASPEYAEWQRGGEGVCKRVALL